ncbi:hypothetical protein D9758_006436 [Tetrapyrgos nigripes]|uniref:Uncharacterized protein n=1 Tax=Tetrapyrgos nigripes TaxID=182062 RepID=A0A8H5GL44_9AGAR|nr:hypothetical protein D9758_006436 [Tetrapyrgos nigripes]
MASSSQLSQPPGPSESSKPAAKLNRTNKFTIREIIEDELEKVSWIASKAFLDDRVGNFIWGFEKSPTTRSTPDGMKVYSFYAFVIKSCFYLGRVVVATVPSSSLPSSSSSPMAKRSTTPPPGSGSRASEEDGEKEEIIAAVACWLPPGKRINIWNLPMMIKCGVLKVSRRTGVGEFNVSERIVLQFMDQVDKTHKGAFRDRAKKSSASLDTGVGGSNTASTGSKASTSVKPVKSNDAWYLLMVMTVKEFEGQGCLSLLMREGYANAAKIAGSGGSVPPFILESSSSRSRDRYMHLGYEIEDQPPTIAGVGKVDSDGLRASKEARRNGKAPGVEYWCMVNWNPKV